jgi:hypothetical protein
MLATVKSHFEKGIGQLINNDALSRNQVFFSQTCFSSVKRKLNSTRSRAVFLENFIRRYGREPRYELKN